MLAAAGPVLPHWVYRMNPVTAVCLVLAGVALILGVRVARMALGAAIGVAGAIRLTEIFTGRLPGVDLLLVPEHVLLFERSRMAPNTAFAFTLLGVAFVLAALQSRRAILPAQLFATLTLDVAVTGLIAYAYGALSLIEFTSSSAMALQTAVCLAAASVGVLWLRPSLALTGIITNSTLGGYTARRLLPLVAAILVGLGAVRVLMAQYGVFQEVTGIALHVTSVLTILTVAVLVLSHRLRDVSMRLAARERALVTTAAELEAARDAANSAARIKAEFIANMSHEIRTPLTAIVGYADRLARRTDLGEAVQRDIRRVDSAAEALLSLVNDVLDFSKLEAGQVTIRPQSIDPSALAVEVIHLFEHQADAKGLALELAVEPGCPGWVQVDPDRIRQVLVNLIGNAVKFTLAGFVRVVLKYDHAAGRLEFEVSDSGPGLTEAHRELLFQRFSQVDASSTRRYGGTGLGLAISKGLLDAMGGDIRVDSSPGGGSSFHVTIPAPVADAPRAEFAADTPSLRGKRVLVVDDEAATRELVKNILSPLGVEVAEAADGVEGVAAASRTAFDVILMDIRMPRLDGVAAAARIREAEGRLRHARILAFSANLEAEAASTGRSGFDGYIMKPFLPDDLVTAVAACPSIEPV